MALALSYVFVAPRVHSWASVRMRPGMSPGVAR